MRPCVCSATSRRTRGLGQAPRPGDPRHLDGGVRRADVRVEARSRWPAPRREVRRTRATPSARATCGPSLPDRLHQHGVVQRRGCWRPSPAGRSRRAGGGRPALEVAPSAALRRTTARSARSRPPAVHVHQRAVGAAGEGHLGDAGHGQRVGQPEEHGAAAASTRIAGPSWPSRTSMDVRSSRETRDLGDDEVDQLDPDERERRCRRGRRSRGCGAASRPPTTGGSARRAGPAGSGRR